MSSITSQRQRFFRLGLGLTFLLTLPAIAAISGSVQTTFANGTTVNGNLYPSKADVYLTGGPQNMNSSGLSPDGIYYFEVTSPSGAVLLSSDSIYCRVVVVVGGVMDGVPTAANDPNYAADLANCTNTGGAFHALGTANAANGSLPVQLLPYNDTTNNGGEYKVTVSTDPTFSNGDTKSDNFKVREPGPAYVTVCKFNDLNGNGTLESGEPFIPGWPITATGVDSVSGATNATVMVQTDDTGCVAFSISDLTAANSPRTVTLTEGTLGAAWTQTAPGNGTYDANGNLITTTGPTTVWLVRRNRGWTPAPVACQVSDREPVRAPDRCGSRTISS